MLSHLGLYTPLRVTNEHMGISNVASTRTVTYGSCRANRRHRNEFMHVLGYKDFPIVVYNYIIGGNMPQVVYVFKVSNEDDETSVSVKNAIDSCIRMSPLHASKSMIKDVRLAIDRCASRSTMFRDSVASAILEHMCGKSMSGSMTSRSREAKQIRDDLTLLITAEGDTDSFIEDLRIYNGKEGTRSPKNYQVAANMMQGAGNLEAHSRRKPCTARNVGMNKQVT